MSVAALRRMTHSKPRLFFNAVWCALPPVRYCISPVHYTSGALCLRWAIPPVRYPSGVLYLRCTIPPVRYASGALCLRCAIPPVRYSKIVDLKKDIKAPYLTLINVVDYNFKVTQIFD